MALIFPRTMRRWETASPQWLKISNAFYESSSSRLGAAVLISDTSWQRSGQQEVHEASIKARMHRMLFRKVAECHKQYALITLRSKSAC